MFGKRLKELREKNNYSMDKLIELYNEKYEAKMNKSTLSRYENELQDPIYTVVINLANFFNVTVDYIAGRTDDIMSEQHPALSPDEEALISDYRKLDPTGKDKISEYLADLARLYGLSIHETPYGAIYTKPDAKLTTQEVLEHIKNLGELEEQ